MLGSLAAACDLTGISRHRYYNQKRASKPRNEPKDRAASHRALLPEESERVLLTLNEERFADKSPAAVHEGAFIVLPTLASSAKDFSSGTTMNIAIQEFYI